MSGTATPEPLVSVIIPVYNAGKYLRETLDCVCNQTLENIEIICVDDGSTDDSLAILQEYAERDARFRILQQKNQYAGVARNNGMAAAKGKYLSFLDADDLFEPDMLQIMSARAEETGADLVCCDVDYFTDDPSVLRPMFRLMHKLAAQVPEVFHPEELLQDHLFQDFISAPWNKLFLSSFVRAVGCRWLDTQYANDLSFVLYCVFACKRMSLLQAAPVHYRERTDSISHTRQRDTAEFFRAWTELHSQLRQANASVSVMKSFSNTYINHLKWFLSSLPLDSREKLLQEYENRYDRPVFHILELPADLFEDQAKLHSLRGLFRPQLSVVVPFEQNPAVAERILRSSCSSDFYGYELVYCCPVQDAVHREMLERCAPQCQQLRIFRGNAANASEFCRSSRTGQLAAKRKLAPNAGSALAVLCNGGTGMVDLRTVSVRQSRWELFKCYRADRMSWCLFGRPFMTVVYRGARREIWVLGCCVAILG